jgi:hypothetical protein
MRIIATIILLISCLPSFAQTRDIPLTKQGAATGTNHKITLTTQGAAGAGHTRITLGKAYAYFSLAAQARTSAGVYDSTTNQLVRTLWSGVTKPSGSNLIEWDGKDDAGTTISTAGKYFEVVSNNLTATWQGVIGNTSDYQTSDSSIWINFQPFHDFVPVGRYIYSCSGYREGAEGSYKFDTASPNQRKYISCLAGYATMNTYHVATDGSTIYFAATDAFRTTANFVYAVTSSDNFYSFSSGQSYALKISATFSSVIDSTGTISTGLAVQQTGNYLFVAHKDANELHVFNKTTGALVQTLTYTAPTALCVDNADNLWMVTNGNTVAKYTVNGNGTLTTATLTLSGLVLPQSITYNSGNVIICDGSSSQQVKAFSNTTGASVWTQGTAGGYKNSPAVSNSKFYFSDVRDTLSTTVCYQSDGSYWVLDAGNYRALHYHADRSYYNQVMYMPAFYAANVDMNNATRVFANYLEFSYDYNNSDIKSAWTLTKNWGWNIPQNLDDAYIKLTSAVTLSNSRTYAILKNKTTNKQEGIELTDSVRFIGDLSFGTNITCTLHKDGSVRRTTGGANGTLSFLQKDLSSFDGSNNPVWGTEYTVASTTVTDSLQPVFGGAQTAPFYVLPNNEIVSFNGNELTTSKGYGYHLGGLKIGETTWKWKTAKVTSLLYKGNFPSQDYYDIGNTVQYSADIARVVDSIVIYHYHGEFWKASETNYFNLFHQDGLPLFQFGTNRVETPSFASPMFSGNALSWQLVKVNNAYYIWQNDENAHAGVHLIKIGNIDSIKVQKMGAKQYNVPIVNTIDLMASVPATGTFLSTSNWTRFPNADTTTQWEMTTGTHSYGKSKDILIQSKTVTDSHYLQYDFGAITSSNWTLSGNIGFPGTMFNNNGGGMYFDVLDGGNKIIARFYGAINFATNIVTITGNTATITSANKDTIVMNSDFERPLSILTTNSGVTFSYANYSPVSTALYDATADWQHPKYLKLNYFKSSSNYSQITDIQNFKLSY